MGQTQAMRQQIHDAVGLSTMRRRDSLLEATFSRLFMGLVYPQIWEDPVVDMAALGITDRHNIVCIASGGCNMMSYLAASPASVSAVDLSPAHVALGRLKIAAAQTLTQEEFRRFFAGARDIENVALFDRRIAPRLDAQSRAYWEAGSFGQRRIMMFARGFHRYGVLGRFLGTLASVARLAGVDLREFVKCETPAEQRRYFDERIVPLLESRLVRMIARRRISLFGLGIPPAQYDKLAADGDGDVLPVLRERIRKLMCDFPVSENYFAWQAFTRRYDDRPDAALPPYLKPANFETVRAAADRASIANISLTRMLAGEPAASKHGYVLLDAQDWMTDSQLAELWRGIDRTAAEDATVIFRTGGAADILPGRLPGDLLSRWRYDDGTSAAGFAADRSAIYGGFHVYRRAA